MLISDLDGMGKIYFNLCVMLAACLLTSGCLRGKFDVRRTANLPVVVTEESEPIATLDGLPATSNDLESFSITVGGVYQYQFAFADGDVPGCATATYSKWFDIAEPLKISDTGAGGKGKYVCVLGRTQSGKVQTKATEFVWKKILRGKVNAFHLTKFTVNAPIMSAPAPASSSCGQWLWGNIGQWRGNSFVLNDKIYITAPCKYNDTGGGGWHLSILSWTPDAASATWYKPDGNGNPIETLNKFSAANDGSVANDFKQVRLAAKADGSLVGYAVFRAPVIAPIVAPSLSALAISHIDTTKIGTLAPFTANDGTWKGSSVASESGMFLDSSGTIYYYLQTRNAPANTAYYLSVISTSDMVNLTLPTAPLVQNYRMPYVVQYGASYFMVAFDTVANVWKIIQGTSPVDWDWSGAQDLNMRAQLGTNSAGWDSFLPTSMTTPNEPLLWGVNIVGHTMYIFYSAGVSDYTAGTTPYGVPRQLGVFTIPITSN